jgi:hypothetical protein
MPALSQSDLLQIWETGAGVDSVSRAVVLAAAAGAGTFEAASDLPIGVRDALLVELRSSCFGDDLECLATCPQCGEDLDVAVPASDLRRPEPAEPVATVEVGGRRVRIRALTSRDVLGMDPARGDARSRLLRRCVLDVDGQDVGQGDDVADAILSAAATALPRLDPQADLRVDLACAVCGHSWTAPFDVPGQVWAEVDDFARRLLADVHALAQAYGWREDDVLRLSPARRRFYLEAICS